MNPKERLSIIDAIALYLQERYSTSQINQLFDGYGLEFEKQVTVNSKRLYAREILTHQSLETIVQITIDLELVEVGIYNLKQVQNEIVKKPTSSSPEATINFDRKVFISHANLDKDLVEKIIDLLENIGVQSENIFCSSFEGYGIPLGSDFLEVIKSKLSEDVLVLFVLSENFYDSPTCLCEMGGAWVNTKEHIPILIPPFTYDDVKGVIPKSQGMYVTDREKLNTLKSQVQAFFALRQLDFSIWERKRNAFIVATEHILNAQKEIKEAEDRKVKDKLKQAATPERIKEDNIINYLLQPLRIKSSIDVDRSILKVLSSDSLYYIHKKLQKLEELDVVELLIPGGIAEDKVQLPLMLGQTAKTAAYLDKGEV